MKKRILAICLATSMVFSLIGCGNQEEKEGKNPSTEVQESSSVEEVVEVNPKEYLPDAIEFSEDSMLKITSSKEGIDMAACLYSSEEESYFNMNVNGIVDFISYKVGDDIYVKNDMTGIVNFLKEIEIESGEEFSESDWEEFKEAIQIGYTRKTNEDESSTEHILSEFISTDEIYLLFDKYNKEDVPEESIRVENGSIYFQYFVDGKEEDEFSKCNVSVVVNEETKKATDVSVTIESPESDQPISTYVTAIPWSNESVDLSWITKETEYTVDDVLTSFASGLFFVILSSVDFDSVEESIPNEIEGTTPSSKIEETIAIEESAPASN